MLKEEVRIRRQPVTEAQEVRETLRRERVELEDATRDGVREAAAPPAAGAAETQATRG
jgi:stress response protein YsnF